MIRTNKTITKFKVAPSFSSYANHTLVLDERKPSQENKADISRAGGEKYRTNNSKVDSLLISIMENPRVTLFIGHIFTFHY